MNEQQFPQGTERVRARGEKSRRRAGGWGLGKPLPLMSCLLAWSSVSKTPVCQVLIVRKVYFIVLFD